MSAPCTSAGRVQNGGVPVQGGGIELAPNLSVDYLPLETTWQGHKENIGDVSAADERHPFLDAVHVAVLPLSDIPSQYQTVAPWAPVNPKFATTISRIAEIGRAHV